tara:strand:+ start:516 stop:947 length:432 start_codon:yes stop_codon:yes gene_type:complete
MAVTYINIWKNILTALKSKIRAEMKCSVITTDEDIKGNQFIKIYPIGSNQLEHTAFMETRQYNINCKYFMLKRKSPEFENYVQNQISILEALLHDNITLSLADNSQLRELSSEVMTYMVEVEDYENYHIVEWELSCIHSGNMA